MGVGEGETSIQNHWVDIRNPFGVGIAGAAVMLHFQRQNAYSQFEESAHVLAEVLYESLVHDMKEANQEHIQDAVALIAAKSSINEVVIFGNAQNIYASGETSEIGQMRNNEEIAEALASGETVTRTEEQYGRSEVCVIVPVLNQPECPRCHRSLPRSASTMPHAWPQSDTRLHTHIFD